MTVPGVWTGSSAGTLLRVSAGTTCARNSPIRRSARTLSWGRCAQHRGFPTASGGFSMDQQVGYVRLFADELGASHIERDLVVRLETRDFVPPAPAIGVSPLQPASACAFLSVPAGYLGDWHPSPRRQWTLRRPTGSVSAAGRARSSCSRTRPAAATEAGCALANPHSCSRSNFRRPERVETSASERRCRPGAREWQAVA